jgi:hypothetical protein
MDFLKFAGICILLLAIVGAALYGLSYAWTDFTGQMEMRRLEAEAEQARAEADRAREQAGLVQAEAARELARGEADAIRAPALAAAKAVNRQSAIMFYWGALTPLGLLFTALVLVVAGFALGMTTLMGGVAFVRLDVAADIRRKLMGEGMRDEGEDDADEAT